MNFDPSFLYKLAGLIIWGVKKFLAGLDETSVRFTARLAAQDITLNDLREGQAQQRTSFAELRTALIGINGDNGVSGNLKALATRVDRLEQRRAKDYANTDA
jgi:hypothetical protein